jgi:hypothetical protein
MNENYIFAYNNIPCLGISHTNSIGVGLSHQEVDTIQKYIDDLRLIERFFNPIKAIFDK